MEQPQDRYPDLRYKLIRGLIQKERDQRRKHYLKNASECTSKAIVSLDLVNQPIRSIKQASKLEGIGPELCKELRMFQASGLLNAAAPTRGQFCSSGAALLVAMVMIKDEGEDIIRSLGMPLIPEACLRERAAQLSEERFQTMTDDKHVNCPVWWRINILASRGYIKKRSVQKTAVYELLSTGEELARQILENHPVAGCQEQRQLQPIRDQLPATVSGKHLYSNDDGSNGVVLCVDTQEWGGDRVGLGELMRLVQQTKIRFRTQGLSCGDYQWILHFEGEERVLPTVIERKRIDDLACSMVDQRYQKQIHNMILWKTVFEDSGVEADLKYLVEGQPEDYVVKCVDGCGSLVRCGYPTVQQVKREIEELRSNPDLGLLQTNNIQATVNLLALITQDFSRRFLADDFLNLLEVDIGKTANQTVRRQKTARAKKATVSQNTDHSSTQSTGRAKKATVSRNTDHSSTQSTGRAKKATVSRNTSPHSSTQSSSNTCKNQASTSTAQEFQPTALNTSGETPEPVSLASDISPEDVPFKRVASTSKGVAEPVKKMRNIKSATDVGAGERIPLSSVGHHLQSHAPGQTRDFLSDDYIPDSCISDFGKSSGCEISSSTIGKLSGRWDVHASVSTFSDAPLNKRSKHHSESSETLSDDADGLFGRSSNGNVSSAKHLKEKDVLYDVPNLLPSSSKEINRPQDDCFFIDDDDDDDDDDDLPDLLDTNFRKSTTFANIQETSPRRDTTCTTTTTSTTCSSSNETEVAQIQAIFPEISPGTIRGCLLLCEGSVEMTIDRLLQS